MKLEDRHQYNGNIKNITLHSESGKENVIEVEIVTESQLSSLDDTPTEKETAVSLPIVEEMIVGNVIVLPKVDIEKPAELDVSSEKKEKDAELDEYKHSLWQWPSGRSCFTKVIFIK